MRYTIFIEISWYKIYIVIWYRIFISWYKLNIDFVEKSTQDVIVHCNFSHTTITQGIQALPYMYTLSLQATRHTYQPSCPWYNYYMYLVEKKFQKLNNEPLQMCSKVKVSHVSLSSKFSTHATNVYEPTSVNWIVAYNLKHTLHSLSELP